MSDSSDSKSNEFKKGEKVEWESSQGTIEGIVKEKLTHPIEIKGHHVAASKDNPEYLVESDRTGKEAAHKPESLQSKEN
jgi:Hypervirulence associated proteins TUDOR domain